VTGLNVSGLNAMWLNATGLNATGLNATGLKVKGLIETGLNTKGLIQTRIVTCVAGSIVTDLTSQDLFVMDLTVVLTIGPNVRSFQLLCSAILTLKVLDFVDFGNFVDFR